MLAMSGSANGGHVASAASPAALLVMEGVSKAFPGVQALSDVELSLYPGSVTALVGENGAGKSTLVKILTGIYRPDAGRILLDGAEIALPSAEAAMRAGVTAIHQETVLFDELPVAENIFLGQELTNRFGLLDWPAMRRRAREILASLEADIDPAGRLKDLGIAQKHMVAIARALAVEARIVIMDEPTAALSHREVEDLYAIVEKLRDDGKAILFISHKFEEIFRIADRYVVLRDGVVAGAGEIADADPDALIALMVGRRVEQIFPKKAAPLGPVVLAVDGLSHATEFADISFEVRAGEILGFYGLVGSGRTEAMKALFGITRAARGSVRLNGASVAIRHPADATRLGLVYVPEERAAQGAVLALPIFQNISLPQLGRTARHGFLDLAREYALAGEYAARLELRAASLSQRAETLSGGNQQKLVIGKWLATRPKVIILDEPTKGIDIGSKAAVHAFMSELVAAGLAVIMVSSDLPEILGMSDRVVVMREGRVVGAFARGAMDAEALVRAATGNVARRGAPH
jgi:rhamnose transport system ATP-binding protein